MAVNNGNCVHFSLDGFPPISRWKLHVNQAVLSEGMWPLGSWKSHAKKTFTLEPRGKSLSNCRLSYGASSNGSLCVRPANSLFLISRLSNIVFLCLFMSFCVFLSLFESFNVSTCNRSKPQTKKPTLNTNKKIHWKTKPPQTGAHFFSTVDCHYFFRDLGRFWEI